MTRAARRDREPQTPSEAAWPGANEDCTLSRLRGLRSNLIHLAIAAHRGRLSSALAKVSIIEFRSVVDPVRSGIEVQNGMVERNTGLPQDRRIQLSVGIRLGDVVEESDGDFMGDGVNLSARIEAAAKPGGAAAWEPERMKRLLQRGAGNGRELQLTLARPMVLLMT
jgi:class 3 adenylate cyclase